MLLITHPLPSDSQTAIPFGSCCSGNCRRGKKSLRLITICALLLKKAGLYIFIIFSLNKGNFQSLHKLKPFVLCSRVSNNLLTANDVLWSCTKASLLDFNGISNDRVKPFSALRFSLILVLGVGTGRCCFFVLGTGIGLYGGIGLASKYCISCRTFLLGVGIGILLLGAGIGRSFFPHFNQILEFTHCDPR